MKLQLPQGHHGSDGKLVLRFLNGIQPQVTQIDGGADGAPAHLQPQHSADDPAAPVLVQRVSLLQALGANIILYVHHDVVSFHVRRMPSGNT